MAQIGNSPLNPGGRKATHRGLLLAAALLYPIVSGQECATSSPPAQSPVCACTTDEDGVILYNGSGPSADDCWCETPTLPGDDDASLDTESPTPPLINGLDAQLEPNPICTISCIVRWTSEEPASSWVEFGVTAPNAYRIGDETLSTDHEVIVVGMNTTTTYQLRAMSETADGKVLRSQLLTFGTGTLPHRWLATTLELLEETKSQGGWTLFNPVLGGVDVPLAVEMVDMNGRPVWYYVDTGNSGRVDIQASWVNNRVVIGPGVDVGSPIFMIDLAGRRAWEGPLQEGSTMSSDGAMHHVLTPLANGDLVTAQIDRRTIDGVDISGEVLRQFNLDNETIWSWTAFDHTNDIPLVMADLGMNGEWLHTNSATVDLQQNVAYMSSYTLKAAYKIDRSDGHVLWTLGMNGDFAPDPHNRYPWFGTLHSFDPIGGGRYLLYDNESTGRKYSRAVIYHLNEDTMQATIEWEYPAPGVDDYWFNAATGDADLLENGNILIQGGMGLPGQDPSRIMEITPSGEKIWHLSLFSQNDSYVGAFQAERLPALAQPMDPP